jgi:cohesin domain-containing protein/carboxypeptidase family protein/dockerin type I repeat protein
MRSKRLLQIFVLLMLLFSSVGGVQSAHASTVVTRDALVINRDLSFWDATYVGMVTSSVYEKWHFDFSETHEFVVTASPITGGLVPLLTLLDANGNTLASGANSLTSTQPAGTYYIQVQPQADGGFYFLTIREIVNVQPSVTTTVNPTNLNVGDTALATVSLNNVPAGGYTSAEFTCTYDASLLEVSNITVGTLFGSDPVSAVNGPQNGSFIVAIAGSNGNKATTSGAVFTFDVKALQAGQASVDCTARVSTGNNTLSPLSSTGAASVTIVGSVPTATSTPGPIDTPTATSTSGTSDTPTATSTSTTGDTATPTATLQPGVTPTNTPAVTDTPGASPTPTITDTPAVTDTPSVTDTPAASPTATITDTPVPTDTAVPSATPLPAGTLNGQVFAGKAVTIELFDNSNTLVATVPANSDGTFSLTAPAGTYAVVATAAGFLSAAGSATITSAGTTTMPNVTLLAGDIDSDNLIGPLDALTIGMNYNSATPTEADLNNDGVINVLDLELLAQNYRVTGPIAWQ